jgi:integrase
MAVKWIATGYKGVRYYEHTTRRVAVGAVKIPDKYFAIRYQKDGTRTEEGLGWSSEGWTAETAFAKLTSLKEAAKTHKDAPTRLAEERKRQEDEKRRREEAERQQEELRKQTERESITVASFFNDTYLPTIRTHRKSADDLHDKAHFRLWLSPVIGEKSLKDVVALDAERVKKTMLSAGKSPRTIQYVLATFRQIWNMACLNGIVSGPSPTKGVKLPKFDNKRARYLTEEEADALLNELQRRDVVTYRMAAISLYTGLRAEDIFKLQWRNVDLTRGLLRIEDPKNAESRYAYVTEPVRKIIDEMDSGEPNTLLFSQKNGLPFKEAPTTFSTAVKALGLNEGVTDRRMRVVFHTLRHTFGSWLAERGVDLYTISKLMGHKTINMTARYAHLGNSALRKAASILELRETGINMSAINGEK